MSAQAAPMAIPFDTGRLDALLEEQRLDAVVLTSKHNIQHFLGGYRYFFYSYMDAHGVSRYLPAVIYVKGRPEEASYVGSPMETYEQQHGKFWMPNVSFGNMTVQHYAASVVLALKKTTPSVARVGVELDFLPHSAFRIIEDGLDGVEIVDASFILALFRAVKTDEELATLRQASDRVVDAMLATMRQHGAGSSKRAIIETLRQEEAARGLHFEYALVNMGTIFNRAPSDQVWGEGETLAIDSGGNYQGYIGDLCRMACAGEPDAELVDLLCIVEEVQQAARTVIRAGVRGGDIYAAPDDLVDRSPHRQQLEFVAHGMGIVSHEAPWLTSCSSVPYAAYHADRPLEAGMVISIETTLSHATRGFIKIEDTVAVTSDGWEAFGDHGRGWNRAGV